MRMLPIFDSYISGIALLGLPAEMYTFGTQYWMIVLSEIMVSFTMASAIIPVFYELNITSSYEVSKLYLNTKVAFPVGMIRVTWRRGGAAFCFAVPAIEIQPARPSIGIGYFYHQNGEFGNLFFVFKKKITRFSGNGEILPSNQPSSSINKFKV